MYRPCLTCRKLTTAIFSDFIYNLDIIKELEERIRDNCSKNEAQNKKFGLLQVCSTRKLHVKLSISKTVPNYKGHPG